MNVKIEDISAIRKRLSFELAADRVDRAIDEAYRQIAKGAKVKGFRQGKIPQHILEKYYAPQMQEKVLGKLINDSYFRALAEHRIPAVSDPEITDSGELAKGKAFSYSAEVEVRPDLEAKDYTGLNLKKEKLENDPAVIDQRLEELQKSRAELKVSSRKKARTGDFVTIDFKGFKDGEAFDGGSAEGHVLELGSGSFIPGFEEQLEGMKREEEREIEVEFPADYGNQDLAGKPAVFKVTLHEIKEKAVPELNAEFAKEFGVETPEELREKLEKNYLGQEQQRIDGELRENLIGALIERNPVEVPEAMVDRQLDYMLNNVRNRMQSQGISMEMLGMNEDSFRGMYRDSAVQQVQGSLILEAIGRQENLTVEDAEVDGKIQQVAEMANAPLEAVKKYYAAPEARNQLLAQIAEEKVIELLLEKAVIEEVSKEELQAEKTPAAAEAKE